MTDTSDMTLDAAAAYRRGLAEGAAAMREAAAGVVSMARQTIAGLPRDLNKGDMIALEHTIRALPLPEGADAATCCRCDGARGLGDRGA